METPVQETPKVLKGFMKVEGITGDFLAMTIFQNRLIVATTDGVFATENPALVLVRNSHLPQTSHSVERTESQDESAD